MHRFDPRRFDLPSDPLFQIELQDPAATRELGARLARTLQGGGFVGLVGELGAGKTTLVQGLLDELGGPPASSPTYTLLNEYDVDPPVYHFDLYRLASVDELETVAYWDYAEDPGAIVLVEWIDQVPAAWFGRGLVLELTHEPDGRRAAVWAANDGPRWRKALLGRDDLS